MFSRRTAKLTVVEPSSIGLTARQPGGSLGGWTRPNTGQSESALRRFEKGLAGHWILRIDGAAALSGTGTFASSGLTAAQEQAQLAFVLGTTSIQVTRSWGDSGSIRSKHRRTGATRISTANLVSFPTSVTSSRISYFAPLRHFPMIQASAANGDSTRFRLL
jgi:hypothetical protein